MNDKIIRLLLIEDDKVDKMAFERFAKTGHLPYDYTIAGSVAEARKILNSMRFDVIISDYMLGDGVSFELFDLFKGSPVIVTTGTGNEEVAVAAMKLGACDYLIKDPAGHYLKMLPATVEIALERKLNEKKLAHYHENLESMVRERTAALQAETTERKQAEHALRESEEKFRYMMEAMTDPVYICSPDFRVEYMNPVMIERTGHDAKGAFCFKALHNLDEKCPWCMHHKTQANEHVESDIVNPRDNRSYHLTQTPVVHGDGSISNMTILKDTTDWIKMETQLRQAQKMEAIGTLAGGIAHDFNNVLFPILGYAEMLKEELTPDNPLHGHAEGIFQSALRARDLVKQILTFSRQGDQDIKPIRLQPIVKEALKLLRASIPTTIDIQHEIDGDCGIVVADPTSVHQVVMNLATNAFHAMEKSGGRLNVMLKQVRFEPDRTLTPELTSGEYACLTVADTGMGIEKAIMDKIFDPYFTTKEISRGTGLGLSVVLGIVKSCSGDIRIVSEPGKGTEVRVYLPVMKRQADDIQTDEGLPILGGIEKILVVDDEAVLVKMEKKMLERLGYQVVTCTGSIEALKTYKTSPGTFDLVVSDMTMPNMTGIELAEEIKKIQPDIPIVLCSGSSYLVDDESRRNAGIQGLVMKPLIMKEFAEIIRKVLDKKNH